MKAKKDVCNNILHIKETSNNKIITLTNLKGDCLIWQSNGSSKFKGGRKNTSVANHISGISIGYRTKNLGINFVELHLNGWGAFRKQTVKGLIQKGLKITLIKENTLFSHNGCRLKKRKRLRRRRQKMYWF